MFKQERFFVDYDLHQKDFDVYEFLEEKNGCVYRRFVTCVDSYKEARSIADRLNKGTQEQ